MTKIAIIIEESYDETQSSPESIVRSVSDILEAHEHIVTGVEQVSVCCNSILEEGTCMNCGNVQNLAS